MAKKSNFDREDVMNRFTTKVNENQINQQSQKEKKDDEQLVRKTYYITKALDKEVKLLSIEKEIDNSSIVREALRSYLEQQNI